MTPHSADNRGRAAYLDAAHRKVEIAKYHLERLVVLLESRPQPTENRYPPVDVQAHFEGVLFAIKAEIDQVTEMISKAFGWPYIRALEQASKSVLPELKPWLDDPLFNELNELRRLAAHHSYVKRPSGPQACWRVEEVGSSYMGARNLDAYCKAVVQYGDNLIKLVVARLPSRLGN
jgi:hypothetical protein